jgi:hypothetical protein
MPLGSVHSSTEICGFWAAPAGRARESRRRGPSLVFICLDLVQDRSLRLAADKAGPQTAVI